MKSKSNPNLENAVSETHNGSWTLLVMDFCVRVALLLLVVNLQKKKGKGKRICSQYGHIRGRYCGFFVPRIVHLF